MAGTIVGVADSYTSVTYSNGAGALQTFATAWYFFQKMIAQGYCTLVASYFGSVATYSGWGGETGHGMDSYTGSQPAGQNAFFCVKFNLSAARPGGGSALGTYYVYFQWATDTWSGTSVSYHGTSFDGVACSVAFCTDDSSPWNGSTSADGTDTKGTPLWTGGAALRVMTPDNGPYGAYSTNKNRLLKVHECSASSGAAYKRRHMMGDADNWWFASDNNDYRAEFDNEWVQCSLYEPFSKYPCSYPLVLMSDQNTLPQTKGSTYGDATGDARYENGGMVGPDTFGNEVGALRPHNYPGAMDSSGTFNPADHLSDSTKLVFWECPTFLEYIDQSGNGRHFMQGQKAWCSEVYGPGPATISDDGTRLFMSDETTFLVQRVAFPWAGNWPPGYRSRTYPPGYQVP